MSVVLNYFLQNRANSKHSKLGFTLIELLLIISIISILAGLLVSIIKPAQYMARARDSRRISDIKSLANSISYALSGNYISLNDVSLGCLSCTSTTGTMDVDGINGWVKYTTLGFGGLSDFVTLLPTDPVNNSTYYFEFSSDASKFELSTKLEDPAHFIKTTNEGGTDMTKYEVGTNLTLIP